MRKFALGLAVLMSASLGVAVPSATAAAATTEVEVARAPADRAIAGQYIVTLRESDDPNVVSTERAGNVVQIYQGGLNGFAARLSAAQLETLRRDPRVVAIEEDQMVTVDPIVDGDSDRVDDGSQIFPPQHLDRLDQRSAYPLNYTYQYTATGAGVRVYVIDSGIDSAVDHGTGAEFGSRAWQIADFNHDPSNAYDCNGHGTHVAGIVGSATYGVAKGALIRAVKVLNCWGSGPNSSVIAGVNWVRNNAIKPAVANMSLGSAYSLALNQAVTALYYSGVFVAAAAGNESQDACNSSPASSLGATTVAASGLFQFPLGNPEDEPTSFTNYGTCVDLFAIGSKVKSTFLNGTVKTLSGTSMASPAVAGVAAIKLGINNSKSAATLRSEILNDATVNVVCCYNNATPNRLLYKSPSI